MPSRRAALGRICSESVPFCPLLRWRQPQQRSVDLPPLSTDAEATLGGDERMPAAIVPRDAPVTIDPESEQGHEHDARNSPAHLQADTGVRDIWMSPSSTRVC